MSTKGKSWVAKKTCVKAFNAALVMRREVIRQAMAHIHSGVQVVIANEEHNIKLRKNSMNGFVQDYVEEIRSLDDIVAKLSKFV